jgi:hypothetical protein
MEVINILNLYNNYNNKNSNKRKSNYHYFWMRIRYYLLFVIQLKVCGFKYFLK